MERRLAAIMLTDMIGYSRLMGLDEAGTIERQKAHRGDVFDPKITQHNGRIVKSTGDGLLVEFPSVVDAVKCAVEVQTELAGRDTAVPDDRRIQYRIGINLGDIVIDADDILGDGVNVAARLEGLAKPGGICISGTVHDQLAGKIDIAFEDAGEQELKNVARPMQVWHWQSDSLSSTVRAIEESLPLARPSKPSIAVLPFRNLSGDPEQEYFADGISEDVITGLSRSSRLFAIARNSTFAYRNKEVETKRICSDLGVRYLLEGSVRKSGSQIRVTGRLIDGTNESQIWAEKYDAQLQDVFEVQDDITRKVVSSVDSQLMIQVAEPRTMPDLSAWDLVRRSWPAMATLTSDSLEEGKQLAKRAFELDQNFSEAHRMFAACLWHQAWLGYVEKSPEILQTALFHGERAVELDARNEYAHWISGAIYLTLREYDKARAALERAVEINPNCSLAYGTLGTVLAYSGDADRSIQNNEIAIRINPRDPSIFFRYSGISVAHFCAQRFEAAAEWAEKVVQNSPAYFAGHIIYIASLTHLGRRNDAARAVKNYKRLVSDATVRRASDLPLRLDESARLLADGLREAGVSD